MSRNVSPVEVGSVHVVGSRLSPVDVARSIVDCNSRWNIGRQSSNHQLAISTRAHAKEQPINLPRLIASALANRSTDGAGQGVAKLSPRAVDLEQQLSDHIGPLLSQVL
jgi:hypothetical protein